MAFLTGLFSVAETIKTPGGIPWEWLILQVFSFIANYGWRIILFTVLLKLLLYPLDFYQRHKMRKNEKITARLKPEMEKLERACAGNKQVFQQKQMELNKREGYSYFSACLPALLTMVIFIWLFSSLNNISQFMIMRQYVQWYDVYTDTYNNELVLNDYDNLTSEDEKAAVAKAAEDKAQTAVYDFYYGEEGNQESFIWIKNVWSPDVPWKKPINEWSAFESAVAKWGTDAGKLGIDKATLDDMMSSSKYNLITYKLRNSEDNKTNGFLILPIFAVGLSFLSQFITQRQQKKSGQANPMGGGMKFMMILFPLMMVFFSLIYTAAFTLYIVLNSGMTILLNLLSTAIFAIKDKAGEKAVVNTVIKYGRPDPNDANKKR